MAPRVIAFDCIVPYSPLARDLDQLYSILTFQLVCDSYNRLVEFSKELRSSDQRAVVEKTAMSLDRAICRFCRLVRKQRRYTDTTQSGHLRPATPLLDSLTAPAPEYRRVSGDTASLTDPHSGRPTRMSSSAWSPSGIADYDQLELTLITENFKGSRNGSPLPQAGQEVWQSQRDLLFEVSNGVQQRNFDTGGKISKTQALVRRYACLARVDVIAEAARISKLLDVQVTSLEVLHFEVVRMRAAGDSFGQITAYCLHTFPQQAPRDPAAIRSIFYVHRRKFAPYVKWQPGSGPETWSTRKRNRVVKHRNQA